MATRQDLNEIEMLKITPVGKTIEYNGKKLCASKSFNGCKGCVFIKDEGARFCEHRTICFANERLDKKSVIFKIVE